MYQEPELPHGSNICFCTACGQLFNSVYAFDMHRVEFKCLSVAEMIALGMALNERGRWVSELMGAAVDRRRAVK